LRSGADIIETNTFNAQRISLADYHMEDLAYEINLEAAKCARKAIDLYKQTDAGKLDGHAKYVAGAIGPTNRTASLSPDVNDPGFRAITFDELVQAYSVQIEALLDGGVDALLVETIFDTLNAKAALFAIEEVLEKRNLKALLPGDTSGKGIPIMISGTITDASGRTLSGQTAEAFLISLSHVPMFSIGFNCALGAEQLQQYVEILSGHAPCYVSAYPNAGLPNAMGHYDQSPAEMASLVGEYCQRHLVNILGGCCGTTPEHIKAIAEMTLQFEPRSLQPVLS
jgi:5-methyltetrahydrofolate--homocysteine methyltransferase